MLAAALLGACATPAGGPPPPPRPGLGAIGIRVSVQPPLGPPRHADRVHFVRVDEHGEEVDDRLWVSDFQSDGRVYLLNVEPGRYRAVEAETRYQIAGKVGTVAWYLPYELIELTATRVVPDRLAYAGSYLVKSTYGICRGDADEAQVRYAERLFPGEPKCGLFAVAARRTLDDMAKGSGFPFGSQRAPTMFPRIDPQNHHYRGWLADARRDAADEGEFLAEAQADLAAAGWVIPAR